MGYLKDRQDDLCKILAVVVTFKPEKEFLVRNVNSLINVVDKILIWENSPEINVRSWFNGLEIEFKTTGKNIGISGALNEAWMYARQHGYTHLLTMDQDSFLKNCKTYVETCLNSIKEPSVFGPKITRSDETQPLNIIEKLSNNDYLITSGILVPLEIINAIGGYNADFKVDAVDLDFCIRTKLAGYEVYRNENGVLLQHFGTPYTKILFGKTFVCPNYSPFRLKGIFRNHIIIYRRYKNKWIKRIIIVYFRHFIPRILLWEDNKWKKVNAIFNGIIEGLKYKIL